MTTDVVDKLGLSSRKDLIMSFQILFYLLVMRFMNIVLFLLNLPVDIVLPPSMAHQHLGLRV